MPSYGQMNAFRWYKILVIVKSYRMLKAIPFPSTTKPIKHRKPYWEKDSQGTTLNIRLIWYHHLQVHQARILQASCGKWCRAWEQCVTWSKVSANWVVSSVIPGTTRNVPYFYGTSVLHPVWEQKCHAYHRSAKNDVRVMSCSDFFFFRTRAYDNCPSGHSLWVIVQSSLFHGMP